MPFGASFVMFSDKRKSFSELAAGILQTIYYQKNPEAARQLSGPLFEDKVIDYIVELANVTDFETNIDELYRSDEVGGNKKTKETAKKKNKSKTKRLTNKADNPPAMKKAKSKKRHRTKSMCFTVQDAKVSILAESVDKK